MSVNPNEANLEALTITIATLEKNGSDENLLIELKKERDKLLKELNVHSI